MEKTNSAPANPGRSPRGAGSVFIPGETQCCYLLAVGLGAQLPWYRRLSPMSLPSLSFFLIFGTAAFSGDEAPVCGRYGATLRAMIHCTSIVPALSRTADVGL